MTKMLPNSFAFGGGNVPTSFQGPHEMEAVLLSLLHVLCGTQWNNFMHFLLYIHYILGRCFNFVHIIVINIIHNGQFLLTSTDGFIFQSTCIYGCGTKYFI